jgi:hypothetical protein
MYFTCDLKIENHEEYGDRYVLAFKTPHHAFNIQLDPYNNTHEEWQEFWQALKLAQPKQLVQSNLMLSSTTAKECHITVSNNAQNVLFETAVPTLALLKPLRLMMALVEHA